MSDIRAVKDLFADGAYDRRKLMDKAAFKDFVVEIVRRIDNEPGFKVLPRSARYFTASQGNLLWRKKTKYTPFTS